MPKAVGRRLGTAVLVGLVASVLLLTLLPADPGSLRFGGVGALWWLGVIVARLCRTNDPRWWLAAGAAIGFGMLSKYSMPFLVAGIGVGVLSGDLRERGFKPLPHG